MALMAVTIKLGEVLMLKEGELAPDFALPDQNGAVVKLSELLKKSAVVVYFYPKDNTPGCTAQSCSFRDNYGEFKANGAQVIGISADSSTSHDDFAKAYSLPFPLLSDSGGDIAKSYGVAKKFGLLAGRVTFVIDQNRKIRYALSSQLDISSHIDNTLEVVKSMQNA